MRGPGFPESTVARNAVFSEPSPHSILKPAASSTSHRQPCAFTSSKASSVSACIFALMSNSAAEAASIASHAAFLRSFTSGLQSRHPDRSRA